MRQLQQLPSPTHFHPIIVRQIDVAELTLPYPLSTGRDVHSAHRAGGARAAQESPHQLAAVAEFAAHLEPALCGEQSH